ncbi:hypothetical protein THIX_90016 [Thiomonas sp. X19]|uniref:hypothetical protein n=1 Tax=Thiomonas sp. X19 TaxID=1050370 RepID=UPI000B65BD6A|nr:hypothetical protein [Thiomonas sp. X19]SCC95247.1 hypothetical protein THIX_90016 [Thiomonas sp. X19]
MNAPQVNADAVLQALSSWGLGDLWLVLTIGEIDALGSMLADHEAGERTSAHMYPEAAQRLGWMAQSCGLDPTTGGQVKAEA